MTPPTDTPMREPELLPADTSALLEHPQLHRGLFTPRLPEAARPPTSRTTRGLRAAGLCCMWAAAGTTARMRACSTSTAATARPTRTAASALDSFSSPEGDWGPQPPEALQSSIPAK